MAFSHKVAKASTGGEVPGQRAKEAGVYPALDEVSEARNGKDRIQTEISPKMVPIAGRSRSPDGLAGGGLTGGRPVGSPIYR
jgi:hypothetical protein